MDRQAVRSSVIKSVAFDPSSGTLEIAFPDGDVYRYFEFPEFLYRGLLAAASKGQYFNRRINGRYRVERVVVGLPENPPPPEDAV